jgi:hypothetical protein
MTVRLRVTEALSARQAASCQLLRGHTAWSCQIQRRTTLWETTLSQSVRYKEELGSS